MAAGVRRDGRARVVGGLCFVVAALVSRVFARVRRRDWRLPSVRGMRVVRPVFLLIVSLAVQLAPPVRRVIVRALTHSDVAMAFRLHTWKVRHGSFFLDAHWRSTVRH